MNIENCCDSRKHLVDLASEIFKGKNISNINTLSNEWIAQEGSREIVKKRNADILARQTLRVLKQIQAKNTKQEIESVCSLIEDSPFFETIKEIANYKVTIVCQAQIFKNILIDKETNVKHKYVSMVSEIFKIAKIKVEDRQIIPFSFAAFISNLTSLPFMDSLKQETQKTKMEDLQRQITDLTKTIERLRERLNQSERQNEHQRAQISKVKSKQMILEDNDFQKDFEFEDISKKKISDGYTIKSVDQMSLNISSKKELQSIACSTIVPFQEKTFVDQQTITISQEFCDSQSQTNDFAQLIAQYVRPLEEALGRKQQQALQWKRKHEFTLEDLNNAQIQMSIIREMYRPKTLFQGEIFEGNENEKKILMRHIEEKGGILIDSTRLLYRYDPRNKTNFHEYIDGVQGIVLIVKSKKGFLFGAYYSGKIEPEKVLNEFGLLISISNDTSYHMIEPDRNSKVVRAVIYDPFYAIFGNAELRIKSGEDFVFSNFGIMNSYFKHNNKKLIDFVGEENKEVKFESYQFYQVRLALQE